MTTPTSGNDEWELFDEIADIGGWTYDADGDGRTCNLTIQQISRLRSLVATSNHQARIQAASDIFNLAHQYAQEDKTMYGAEELRAYHYFSAIHKIGEFDGR